LRFTDNRLVGRLQEETVGIDRLLDRTVLERHGFYGGVPANRRPEIIERRAPTGNEKWQQE
jgi:hypothetical protein